MCEGVFFAPKNGKTKKFTNNFEMIHISNGGKNETDGSFYRREHNN